MTRGPYTFRGYYNSPQHNAEAFDAEGFYCSGDLISIDEDGYITVQGREKDQINRGGEKIAAEEIENLLLRHEAVIHAALVSIEDNLLGEKSCAYLVVTSPLRAVGQPVKSKGNRIASASVKAFCRRAPAFPWPVIATPPRDIIRFRTLSITVCERDQTDARGAARG